MLPLQAACSNEGSASLVSSEAVLVTVCYSGSVHSFGTIIKWSVSVPDDCQLMPWLPILPSRQEGPRGGKKQDHEWKGAAKAKIKAGSLLARNVQQQLAVLLERVVESSKGSAQVPAFQHGVYFLSWHLFSCPLYRCPQGIQASLISPRRRKLIWTAARALQLRSSSRYATSTEARGTHARSQLMADASPC